MFHWEPEGRYRHRLCTAITPFWLSTDEISLCTPCVSTRWATCQSPVACTATPPPRSEGCRNTTTAKITTSATATTTTTTHLKHPLCVFPMLRHVFRLVEQGVDLQLPVQLSQLPHHLPLKVVTTQPLPILTLLPQSTLTWSIPCASFLCCAMFSDSLSNVLISSCLYSYPTTSLWRLSQHNSCHFYHCYHNHYNSPEASPGHLSCAAPYVLTHWATCQSPAACTAARPVRSGGCPAQSWPGSAWWPWARCLGCSSERWGSSSGSVSLEITRGEIYLQLFH